jgi:hypothetical protein
MLMTVIGHDGTNDGPASEHDAQLTVCGDGSYCCGPNNSTCCNANEGVWIVNGQVVDVEPISSTSSSTSSTILSTTATASSVPALVLEPITTGPPTAAPTFSPLPSYSGQGDLLQDYCITPEYVLLDGPTAYWAPVVGCVGGKSDCCPYAVQSATSISATTVYVVSTFTVDVGPSGETQAPYGGSYAGFQAYPTPVSSNQATLANCPGDYVSVSGGCCPS